MVRPETQNDIDISRRATVGRSCRERKTSYAKAPLELSKPELKALTPWRHIDRCAERVTGHVEEVCPCGLRLSRVNTQGKSIPLLYLAPFHEISAAIQEAVAMSPQQSPVQQSLDGLGAQICVCFYTDGLKNYSGEPRAFSVSLLTAQDEAEADLP